MARSGIISAIVVAALLASGSSRAENRNGICHGILHRDSDGLRLGGGRGEDEGICLVGRRDIATVLAACAVNHRCWIKGQTSDCKGSGECSEISGIVAVRRR